MMQKKKVRAGIVGSGFAASFHYESLHKVYGVEIECSGIYSLTKAKREAFAQKRGIRALEILGQTLEHS